MAQSSLLGGERALVEPPGRDTAALGPSDSSDSGSDVAGLDDPETGDPALPVDVALSDDHPHALLGSESLGGSSSDAAGTGERRSAGSDAGAIEAADIGVDRVFVAGEDGETDPSDDEDPDLAFIDDIQAEAMPADDDAQLEDEDDEAEDDEDDEDDDARPDRAGRHAARSVGAPLPEPMQPNPGPDEPEPSPENADEPAEAVDPSGRPIPALLRRAR